MIHIIERNFVYKRGFTAKVNQNKGDQEGGGGTKIKEDWEATWRYLVISEQWAEEIPAVGCAGKIQNAPKKTENANNYY